MAPEKGFAMKSSYVPPELIADMFGVHRNLIVALARQGRLPHVRLGKHYRFRLDQIMATLGLLDDVNHGPVGKGMSEERA